MRDITFTTKDIAKITWPVVVEFTLAATVGISDTIMVSNVGDIAVSAVGLVDSINMLFINVFTAIATGTTVIVAQLFGKGDRDNIHKTIAQSTLLLFLVMSAAAALVIILNRQIFDIIYPEVEAAVRENALKYFIITALTYPLVAVFSNLAGAFRGKGNTKIAMRGSLIINVINISLNALFIYGFGMGVGSRYCNAYRPVFRLHSADQSRNPRRRAACVQLRVYDQAAVAGFENISARGARRPAFPVREDNSFILCRDDGHIRNLRKCDSTLDVWPYQHTWELPCRNGDVNRRAVLRRGPAPAREEKPVEMRVLLRGPYGLYIHNFIFPRAIYNKGV